MYGYSAQFYPQPYNPRTRNIDEIRADFKDMWELPKIRGPHVIRTPIRRTPHVLEAAMWSLFGPVWLGAILGST